MDKKIQLIGSFATDWIRYSDYEIKNDLEGNSFIIPRDQATYSMYNPFDVAEDLLIDLLRVGDLGLKVKKMKKETGSSQDEALLMEKIRLFAIKYGLFGLVSANVMNRHIIGDKEVILVENQGLGIKEKSLPTEAYMKLFTPFAEESDLSIRVYKNSVSLFKAEDSPKFYGKRPLIMDLIFSKFYGERLDWFIAFSGMIVEHFNQLLIYRNSRGLLTQPVTILADGFKANKIGFTISQLDKTTIAWEFDSLKTTIETIYGFAISDEKFQMGRCEHCREFFMGSSPREKYCSPSCRNRANVAKSRKRKAEGITFQQDKESYEKRQS